MLKQGEALDRHEPRETDQKRSKDFHPTGCLIDAVRAIFYHGDVPFPMGHEKALRRADLHFSNIFLCDAVYLETQRDRVFG